MLVISDDLLPDDPFLSNKVFCLTIEFDTEKNPFALIEINGDSLGIRTPDPLIKSQ